MKHSIMNKKCLICEGGIVLLDVVDFNKNCEESRGKFLGISGQPIYYSICKNCNFVSCETMFNWNDKKFLQKVYNDGYASIDPDYLEIRPKGNANLINNTFQENKQFIKHLDYGGGNGALSNSLRECGWNSESYDPFLEKSKVTLNEKGYSLITAFEVFEHVPNPKTLMEDLVRLLSWDGVVIFSTLISDGNLEINKRINWWYCAPRNGHVSIFSRKSLQLIASKYDFNLASVNDGLHVMFRAVPEWATNVIRSK